MIELHWQRPEKTVAPTAVKKVVRIASPKILETIMGQKEAEDAVIAVSFLQFVSSFFTPPIAEII